MRMETEMVTKPVSVLLVSWAFFVLMLHVERWWEEFVFEVKYKAWLDSLPVAEKVAK